MPVGPGSTPASSPLPVPAPPAAAPRPARRDRWATWQAFEKQREENTKREIELALLSAVILIALGGSIYFSFWSTP